MRRMRGAVVGGAAAVVTAAIGGMTAAPAAGAVGAPVAGLAYHGSVDMVGGRVDVRFTPHNHGTAAVPDSTVRIRWSQPLADAQTLPAGCARAEERAVLCRVGALGADAVGQQIGLRVWLRDAPAEEVVLEFDTVWSGGEGEEKREGRGNDQQRVLVLETGDTYYF
ncbi:hypothetical protein [Streptomyces lanatus]|uniref:Uncharacterized protein n=1 Tax=Streptomyces lanatus TaxID=66900 RepID=A0ABV1Y216_9ACTN|nr:hypothetical protein [Streptomyces lanatus]GHH20427.1 hypothetical protein GCM10018780_66840 [Streptomyces lanatus]